MTVLLNLGGTIALAYQDGQPKEVGFQEFITSDVTVVDVAPTSSNGLGWRHLRILRERLLAKWRAGETRFVVTVGTDALEEVLYFLSLVIPSGASAAVVGAIRPRSAPDSDGPLALSQAFQWLDHGESGEIVACCESQVIKGPRVTKAFLGHWTFQPCSPADDGLIPWVLSDRCKLLRRSPQVPMLTVGVEAGVWLAKILRGGRFEGVVIQAFGPGDVPPQLVKPIRHLLSRQIPVVLVSRANPGRVEPLFPGIPGTSHELLSSGVLSAGALDGVRARIRLLVALAARPRVSVASVFVMRGESAS